MNALDQISLQLYYFLQTPLSKIIIGGVLLVLIVWGIFATRDHAYHYAMKGSKFGATTALIMFLFFLGLLAYLFVDKQTLSDILSGRRPLSELPLLAQSTYSRFRFVLGASTDTQDNSALTPDQIVNLINNLPAAQKAQVELQMCRNLIQTVTPK